MRLTAPFLTPAFLSLALLTSGGCANRPDLDIDLGIADLVLRSANVISVDSSIGTAQAIAIRGDRILAVGDNVTIDRTIGQSTRVLDLDGTTIIPGFIEGHGHFTGIGESKQNLDLMHVENWDEVISIVAEAARTKKPGEWIIGRGWHQEKWNKAPEGAVEGFPTHESLSAVTPDNPVCLKHASGHSCFFNQKAMEIAGITKDTADPPGGDILKQQNGSPTGVFRETAQRLVGQAHQRELALRTKEQVEHDLRRTIELADQECLENGVTSFQDAGSSLTTIDLMKKMAEAGELGTRLWVMIRQSNESIADKLQDYRMIGVGNHHLTVRAIKRSIDGALGNRGAWLLEPYHDQTDSTGLNTATVKDVTETARLAAENDYQLCVHAIGDRANREVLDIFEKTLRQHNKTVDHRWRVEHAQHLNPTDIPRFAKLGIIASMQGIHCTSDAPWVLLRLGANRAEQGAYVWQKLMQSGALVTNGTDAPVEDISPIQSYYATVSRMLKDGHRFYPNQRMSRMEALKSYTINCAKAAFEEDLKGSLSPGKLADIAVLSKDILTVPENEILDTEVLYTIVGGKILYEKGASQ